jgi:WD40 repeat protein
MVIPRSEKSASALMRTRSYPLQTTQIWDLKTNQKVTEFEDTSQAALSPDGQTLATINEGKIQHWQLSSQQPLKTLEQAATEYVSDVTFSPDGKFIAANGSEPTSAGVDGGLVHIWDAKTGETRFQLKLESGVRALAFSADGQIFVTGEESGMLKFWDTPSGTVLKEIKHTYSISSIVFSPDGTRVAVGSEATRIYATPELKPVFKN